VGGAIVGNAHYGGRGLGELVVSARLASREGAVVEVPQADLAFAYDRSRLQETGEVLLSAVLRVEPGRAPATLRGVARQSLRHRKTTQPLDIASAGCIFQNLDEAAHRSHPDLPVSAGALIDRAGLKGRAVGDAVVSATHANFILNRGRATASEIRTLIATCKTAVWQRFGVELNEEIRYLGEF
jgi:UDP-N-acetylmuramate dehydrogenase